MNKIKQSHFLDFYSNLIEGNKDRCSEIVKDLLDEGVDLKEIYVELFQKALYRIGKLWDKNEITIPEEHMATQIIEALLSKFSPAVSADSNLKVVVTCIDKEFHEIGAKMVANIFELNGWKTFYLGASVPLRELTKFINNSDPQIIALSWSLYLNLARFLEMIDTLTKLFPTKKIIVGGQALAENSTQLLKKYNNVLHIQSIYELDEYLKNNF
ncbi:MAG: cobalamin-dependent protein [Ignavibacterium sp.]|nr:cobalamin-dependent protein [Ignavibacterium sp.]